MQRSFLFDDGVETDGFRGISWVVIHNGFSCSRTGDALRESLEVPLLKIQVQDVSRPSSSVMRSCDAHV